MDLITRTLALYIICCILITLQNIQNTSGDAGTQAVSSLNKQNALRDRRAVVYKRKTGPIRQIFGLIYEQWNDTRQTYNVINNMLNEFIPASTTTTQKPVVTPNASTTAAPYRITRAELAKILRRNLRGLMRLYNLELQDALKQSEITRKEFRKNVTKEVAKFL